VLRMAASAYLTSPGGGPSISSEQNDEGRTLLMTFMMTPLFIEFKCLNVAVMSPMEK
jgi:hypothetical protein